MILPKLFSPNYQFQYTMILPIYNRCYTQTKMHNLYYDNILQIIMMIQPTLSTMLPYQYTMILSIIRPMPTKLQSNAPLTTTQINTADIRLICYNDTTIPRTFSITSKLLPITLSQGQSPRRLIAGA